MRRLGIVAWALVLMRLTGESRVRFGAHAADGRRSIEIDLAATPTVGALLASVDAALARAPAESPAGEVTAWRDDGVATAPAATALVIGLASDGRVHLDHDRERVSESAARMLVEAFDWAWGQAVGPADALVTALPALPLEEFERLSRLSGAPLDATLPEHATVPERIEAHAARSPQAVAVSFDGGALTYAELNSRANRLARRLRSMGAGPEQLVGIAMERSAEMVIGLLAILKAGAAYLPLDLSYPAERIEFALADAQAAWLLTDRASAAAMPSHGARVIVVDDPATGLDGEDDANLGVAIAPDSLAYVIYTSGSTGRPKGCQVTHANMARLFTATAHWFDFGPGDAWTFFHSHAFDFSVWEIWGALVHGGRVVVVPYMVSRSPAAFVDLLARERVTVLNQTPSAFRALIQADLARAADAPALSLRTVVFGGEALELQMLRPWFEKHGDETPSLVNMYGITETTVHVTYRPIRLSDVEQGQGSVIGEPIPDLRVCLLNALLQPVPVGVTGELFVAGAGVSRGYLRRPELNAERFIDWTAPDGRTLRLYRSGDLGRWLPDGDIEYLGRSDHQVKIRGFRIETGEIESALARHPSVRSCAVIARTDAGQEARLVAYVVAAGAGGSAPAWREHLATTLPAYMIPSAFVVLPSLPLTENGKLDRKALPAPGRERPELSVPYESPRTDHERIAADAFAAQLGLERVGRLDNFFELGGSSLQAVQALQRIAAAAGRPLSVTEIFTRPSPATLADAMGDKVVAFRATRAPARGADLREPIAVIGMAGRFPGASQVEALWSMLAEGRDGITRFDAAGLDPSIPPSLRDDPMYVRARGVIDGIEDFDPAFFGMSQREAEVMDPQHRVMLELAWECLERAGYAPGATPMPVAVFAGAGTPSYLQRHVLAHPEAIERVGELQVQLANDKDYIATRVAYKLDLKGPAVNVNTACSTSLVAIAQAVDSLRLGRCDMALAGAANVTCPSRSGYLFQDGSMLSSDGQTRTFDASAEGTAFNDGAAVVLLKRLSDALADGDTVHALVLGVATNNDGGGKASFTAPSVEGQAAVIAAALDDAGVDARSIGYVEAHGTATPLGDPVEVEGLTRAYSHHTSDVGFCKIGSVKSHVGHVVTAAGATGLIKVALSLTHEMLPATLHYRVPNPKIDFASGPFVVVDRDTPWPRGAQPRRAGLSSFGVGGTNAHAVLQEPPLLEPTAAARGAQLIRLSARSRGVLDTMARELAAHLRAEPGLNLADVAHTLDVGRNRFAHRLAVTAVDATSAATALVTEDAAWRVRRAVGDTLPSQVWLFPGQGAQYAGMGRALYEADVVFRVALDTAFEALAPHLAFDLKASMFGEDAAALVPTSVTQPAIFALQFALGSAWLSRGARPTAFIGHSIGEFAAAALAGVMSLADAARLVARRGALMQALPAGAMLSVRMPVDRLRDRLPEGLSLAAENGPQACVVAGPEPLVAAFEATLLAEGEAARRLQTSHAFHSSMMDAAMPAFEAEVRATALSAPNLKIVSTLTGRPMTAQDATDPMYWVRHLREPVLFSKALRVALSHGPAVYVEIGPRAVLSTLLNQHPAEQRAGAVAVASLADRVETEHQAFVHAEAQLWALGIELHPVDEPDAPKRRRVVLPTYPFERRRCWLDAPAAADRAMSVPAPAPAVAPAAAAAIPPSPTVNPQVTMSTTAATSTRRDALSARLRTLFEDVAGLDLESADGNASFMELGLDSLMLTQASLQVRKNFAVAVTFRQLMEQHRSFDALAAFIDASTPADAPAPAAPAAVAPVATAPVVTAAPVAVAAAAPQAAAPVAWPAPVAVAASGSAIEQLLQQQMQLMSQQLALLAGAPAVASVAVVPPAAAPVAAVAPVATPAAAAAPAQPAVDEPVAPLRYDVKKAFGAIARIHTQAAGLTPRQQARLQNLIQRYVGRTQRSKAYTVQHRSHLADPRIVNGFRPMTKEITYQIVVDRSKGSRVWDIDGNEYIDVLNGFGMCMFGWQPDFVQKAAIAQLEAGHEIGPMHPLAGEVAQLVCELTGFERAGLCNTGSEAVMAAIRIARTVTGRNTIVTFTGSYHGTFDEVLVRAGRNAKGIPAAPGIMPGAFGDIRVLDYGTPESLEYIRAHADELAAVIVEPVQSRRPDFQPKEFLKEVRAITEKSGTCLVFDEVITGFRSHPGGVQALFDIRADLATYGKVIGGGYPVGVVAGRREYMDALDGGAWQYGDDSMPTVGVTYFAGTFVRHPLAMAAAKASLLHLKAAGPELQSQLNLHTAAMANELNAFCREVGAPLAIRHFSSLWRVTFLEDHPMQDLFFAMMRTRGIHMLDNFPCFMTTAHSTDDVARIKTAFKESVLEMQESEFLPGGGARQAAPEIDANRPPVPGARLGRDAEGRPAWFVANPDAPGKYVKVESR